MKIIRDTVPAKAQEQLAPTSWMPTSRTPQGEHITVEQIADQMHDRTRPPEPFIPKDATTVQANLDAAQAAAELRWARAVEDYRPDRRGMRSLTEWDQARTAQPPPPPTPTPPADEFDAVKVARRILDDVGSPLWDLHDKAKA
jgi:hypothetical protein